MTSIDLSVSIAMPSTVAIGREFTDRSMTPIDNIGRKHALSRVQSLSAAPACKPHFREVM